VGGVGSVAVAKLAEVVGLQNAMRTLCIYPVTHTDVHCLLSAVSNPWT
jgi:hypothetical protein